MGRPRPLGLWGLGRRSSRPLGAANEFADLGAMNSNIGGRYFSIPGHPGTAIKPYALRPNMIVPRDDTSI
jgi:hypothetical protein